jgi:membrane protein implicated in regulation of membrane protease activity
MLDRLANLLNRVNDSDLHWVGFRMLRPAPEANLTARVVAVLCLVYCPLSALCASLIMLLVMRLSAGNRAPVALYWITAAAAAVTFLLLQSLLAWAWNRRAQRLRTAARPKPQQHPAASRDAGHV